MLPCQANPPRNNGRDPKSNAEQVNEKLLFVREEKLCSKETVSVLQAWTGRLLSACRIGSQRVRVGSHCQANDLETQ